MALKDFDEYINGKWKSLAKIPPESGAYSVSDEVEDSLFASLRLICRNVRASSPDSLVGKFYASGMASRAQQRGIRVVQTLINKIDCIKDTDDVIRATVEQIKSGMMSTFQVVVAPDGKNTSIYALYLTEGDVPINNLGLYSKPDSQIMKKYGTYMIS